MKAKDVIYAEALEAMSASHNDNEFYTPDEARARLSAVINMATALDLATTEEIEAAKAQAREDYLSKK